MKRRKGRKPLDKESKAEDWCFCCKDGGELLICDYKECLKAYHCKCVGKDDSFMSSGKLWSCDWHFCRSCRKASRYYCLCCPSAVCSSCAYIQDFVQIKGKYGMCTHCLKLALLIEENMNVDSDGEQVEFDSVDTLEGLFKEYYELKKGTLGLNSKVLRSAKRRLTMGRNYPSDSEADQYDEVGDNHLTSDDESMDDSEGERKRKRSKGKQSLNRQKGRSSKMEFDGWASKSLIQFLRLIGKDTIESLSEQEVTSIINDYIRHHKLTDPKMKKRILCDAHLQSLFRKKVVHKNKIKDLLEAHFYENQQESEEVEDEMECDLDVDNYKGKEKGKREAPKKEREREASVPQSRFAAIVGENLKLVYLKKSLVYELHKQPESFKDKITGCFVRAKAHPHDIYQRNSHLLMRVTGVKQALQVEKNSDTVLLVSEFPGEISMSKLSDCDFSEEECQNLTGRVKAGLLQKPTLVDLEKKARILHKDITKHVNSSSSFTHLWFQYVSLSLSRINSASSEVPYLLEFS
ncbi:hypothetical protein LIER_38236 [Lithospermum erythrorhizon]|uniref:Chromatin regulator PHD family n=1 Tax=Lithospermum erythrorhizon TaxID=34254 RepID=A0AAV3Q0S4_LITER